MALLMFSSYYLNRSKQYLSLAILVTFVPTMNPILSCFTTESHTFDIISMAVVGRVYTMPEVTLTLFVYDLMVITPIGKGSPCVFCGACVAQILEWWKGLGL